MEKKLKSTPLIQEANERLWQLQENLPQIMKQPIWRHRISIQEKITYLEAIAQARRFLWQVIEKEYPEIIDQYYSVSSSYVTYTIANNNLDN